MLKPTLNHTGFMITKLDQAQQAFVDYAAEVQGLCLDMGAAYGIATLAALQKGAKMVAADSEQRHLDILKEQTSTELQKNLQLITCKLPDVDFPDNYFSAILCSRVFHFLKGEDIDTSMKKFVSWLKPNGRLFLITETPYVGIWKAIVPEYEKRKAAGERWPAYMEDFKKYHNPGGDRSVSPQMLNPIDKWQLERMCTEVNLTILESSYIDRKEFGTLYCYDGRESAVVIAQKSA